VNGGRISSSLAARRAEREEIPVGLPAHAIVERDAGRVCEAHGTSRSDSPSSANVGHRQPARQETSMPPRSKTATGRTESPNPGLTFKAKIQKAKLDGIDPSTLLLRLTRSDVSRLKRDRSLATSDISFANGEMHYLDVMVSEGEVGDSELIILQR
jgi:hypothetical protein